MQLEKHSCEELGGSLELGRNCNKFSFDYLIWLIYFNEVLFWRIKLVSDKILASDFRDTKIQR